MIHRTTCNNCGSLLEYDSASTHEGLRDLEDILCPVCGKKVATVFTNLIPIATLVKAEDIK